MDNTYAIRPETGLAALLTTLPAQPKDYDINEADKAGVSWKFPLPHFVQLEIPASSNIATWIS